MVTSGLRIGTPALAARGFDDEAFREVSDIIARALAPSSATRCARNCVVAFPHWSSASRCIRLSSLAAGPSEPARNGLAAQTCQLRTRTLDTERSRDALAQRSVPRLAPEVEVLGPVRAWQGETELDLGAPRQRAVLAVLASRSGRSVARGELIDSLWGEHAPASAEGSVHTYIAGLACAGTEPDASRTVAGAGERRNGLRAQARAEPARSRRVRAASAGHAPSDRRQRAGSRVPARRPGRRAVARHAVVGHSRAVSPSSSGPG